MPYYLFTNGKEVKEIFFHMNDKKEYIEDNIKWDRIYTIPNSAVDTICDPYSAKDFVKVTNKKGTVGDVLDKSAELSEKRGGVNDPIKAKYYENYSKRRNGAIHPDKVKESSIKNLEKMGVSVKV